MTTSYGLYLLSKEGINLRREPACEEIRRVFGQYPVLIHGPDWEREGFRDHCFPVSQSREEELLPGVIACSTGHCSVLWEFLRTKESVAFVFEDDCQLIGDLGEFQTVIEDLPSNFAWCKLCNTSYEGGAQFQLPLEVNKIPQRAKLCSWSTVGYLVSRAGAMSLLQEAIPQWTTFDCLTRLRGDREIAFNVVEPLVRARKDIPSLIHP